MNRRTKENKKERENEENQSQKCVKHTKFLLNAPLCTEKTLKPSSRGRASNNLLHGSVAKLSNHFMIRARRRLALQPTILARKKRLANTDLQPREKTECARKKKLFGLKIRMCKFGIGQIVHYLCL